MGKEVKEKAAAVAKAKVDKEQAKKAAADAKSAHKVAEKSQAVLTGAQLQPANTAYGKLPAMAKHKGYLRVMAADSQTESAFIKFPTNTLKAADTIVEAYLRVYKFGGG